jgi:two-component SAPR family response regulator
VDAPVIAEEARREEPVADDRPSDDAPSDGARQPWTLMVRVLGPVDVVDAEGRQAEFERAKALELVTWLAQHPQSATRAGARAALWAIDVSNASFSNVVSEARRALARLASPPDGADWVARTYAQRLPLHPEVVLDADLVRRHLEQARRLPDTEAIGELQQALELVRGAPYAGRRYLWPDAEALPSTLTLLVTSVAAELGHRLLDAGDLDGVFAATAVGLDVLPGHEELIALRLRAHAQRGDRSALHREYMSYEHAVLADPWDGEPSPTLVALRRELLQPVAGE